MRLFYFLLERILERIVFLNKKYQEYGLILYSHPCLNNRPDHPNVKYLIFSLF
ncbi:hypothetical protein GGQ57_002572 [Parabacteroides faecis]|uniref:Uncharacterized protein n=1 Tax=Parabacteroides faecis TaxID=1217282 RepID=A0ABR6KMD2_9BACT|nr:hypothetical protein [Parabacteroides faecis]